MNKFNTSLAVASGAVGIFSFVSDNLAVFSIICVGLIAAHILIWRLQPRILGEDYNQSAPFLAFIFFIFSAISIGTSTFIPDSGSKDASVSVGPKEIQSLPPTKPEPAPLVEFSEQDFEPENIENTLGARLEPGNFENPRTGNVEKGLVIREIKTDGPLHKAGLGNGDLLSEVASNGVHSVSSASNSFKNAVISGRKSVLLYVWKGKDDLFLTMKMKWKS